MRKAASTMAWAPGLARGLPILLLVAGCAHHDVVDTPVSWWHQLEGGAIAQQRPPPPGVDDPYPKIGTTPAAAPQVASIELRRSLTAGLVEQRNLSMRLNAHDPLPPPVVAPVRTKTPAAVPAAPNPQQSSATLDAAEAPASPHSPPVSASPERKPGGRANGADEPGADGPELAMPDIVPAATVGVDGAIVLPAIPSAPPPPPGLPGIAMPPPPSYTPPPRPQYRLTQAPGDPLQFPIGSDALSPGQAGVLHAIAVHRGTGSVFVHGYGDAASDAPQDQAQALTLATLRARSVADALEKQGVPDGMIRIRADAFGRGASAGLID